MGYGDRTNALPGSNADYDADYHQCRQWPILIKRSEELEREGGHEGDVGINTRRFTSQLLG